MRGHATCTQRQRRPRQTDAPVQDVSALQVVEREGDLADVELDPLLVELDVLLHVVAQVAAEQQVHHHEHVLLILEQQVECVTRPLCFLDQTGRFWNFCGQLFHNKDTRSSGLRRSVVFLH